MFLVRADIDLLTEIRMQAVNKMWPVSETQAVVTFGIRNVDASRISHGARSECASHRKVVDHRFYASHCKIGIHIHVNRLHSVSQYNNEPQL